MDIHDRNFPTSQKYSLYSRVWTNSNDNGTFWTADIAASYGIEMYPIQGGSLYLGHDTVYVKRLWDEIVANTGIASNQVNPNLWHDMMWQYLAFKDPAKAIEMYNSYPNREIKFGISEAQTYHWLHAMNALGRVDASITANYPIAAAFRMGNQINYVAQNYGTSPLTVKFSTGYELIVPAGKMATSRDGSFTGTITSSFPQAFVGGSVKLTVEITSGSPTKVELMDGTTSLGTLTNAPYTFTASNLQLGIHNFYAKVFDGEKYTVTNTAQVLVGNQVPYSGTAAAIPGIIEAGKYDIFEGGKGQNISYLDVTSANLGKFRTDESVDATLDAAEGAIVSNISAGEWLEYTVNVAQTGLYSLAFRYASGNSAGGGPFSLELDGQSISSSIVVPSTSTTVWTIWATKTVNDIPLTAGKHILKIAFSAGEFNLGKMTFTRTGDLAFSYPTANAGADLKVVLPASSTTLNGSASTESASKALTYVWEQIYGPTVAVIANNTLASTDISGLAEGMYSFRLTVKNTDLRIATDEVLVMVTSTLNVAPTVSLTAPANNTTFTEGKPVTISATASDFDGTITKVEFYQGTTLLATSTTAPYTTTWNPTTGNYAITAKATDNGGAVSTSQVANVTISPLMSCTTTSTVATQGVFSVGYKCTYETVGTDVTVTLEMLDDKVGVIAYLWKETPFGESAMTNVSGKIFSLTIGGQTPGATISYACKFAYSGGMSVTKYITYVVGTNCGSTTNDTQAPTAFTATLGAITANSVELLLNATDNSGTVVYNVTYGTSTASTSTASGTQKSLLITALTPNTPYSFSVTASDLAGNKAANNPIVLSATTAANTNTECAGSASDASQGAFSVGYKYGFTTTGSDVKIDFELLDDKTGVAAYLWNYTSGFAEVAMTNVSGKKFSKTLTGQTAGAVIKIACKFAYAGGMVVTKQFSYTVGNSCAETAIDNPTVSESFFYPNPTQDKLQIKSGQIINQVIVRNLVGQIIELQKVDNTETNLDLSQLSAGNYFVTLKLANGKSTTQKIVKL
jgi:endo-1,3(4)-beta-glucanase